VKGFFKVDNAFFDNYAAELGPIGMTVYMCLSRHANNNQCWPSHRLIAKKCGIGKRSVVTYVSELEKLGLISVHRVKNEKGVNEKNMYTLLPYTGSATDALPLVQEIHHGSATDAPRVVQQMHTNKTKFNKTNRTRPRNKFSDDDMKLAKFIFSRILQMNEREKEPDYDKWADTIRVTREKDKRTHKEIQNIFIWANNNSFWKSNIRSPGKLREKMTTLEDQMNTRGKTNGKPNRHNNLQGATGRALNELGGVQNGVYKALDSAKPSLPASELLGGDG